MERSLELIVLCPQSSPEVRDILIVQRNPPARTAITGRFTVQESVSRTNNGNVVHDLAECGVGPTVLIVLGSARLLSAIGLQSMDGIY